jgi:hypothetical protein
MVMAPSRAQGVVARRVEGGDGAVWLDLHAGFSVPCTQFGIRRIEGGDFSGLAVHADEAVGVREVVQPVFGGRGDAAVTMPVVNAALGEDQGAFVARLDWEGQEEVAAARKHNRNIHA